MYAHQVTRWTVQARCSSASELRDNRLGARLALRCAALLLVKSLRFETARVDLHIGAAGAQLESIGDARGWLHTLAAHSCRCWTLQCDGFGADEHNSAVGASSSRQDGQQQPPGLARMFNTPRQRRQTKGYL
jgi:hypothetical protein